MNEQQKHLLSLLDKNKITLEEYNKLAPILTYVIYSSIDQLFY